MIGRRLGAGLLVGLCACAAPVVSGSRAAPERGEPPRWDAPPSPLSGGEDGAATSPELATDGRGAWIAVWVEAGRNGGPATLEVARSEDGGARWSLRWTIPAPEGRDAEHPSVVALPDGSFWIAFLGRARLAGSQGTAVHAVRLARGAGAPEAPLTLSATEGAPAQRERPRVFVDGAGQARVAWRERAVGSDRLLIADALGSAFRPARPIGADDPGGGAPWLCADPAGGREAPFYLLSLLGPSLIVRRSDDAGASWAVVARPASDAAPLPPSCVARGDELWIAYARDGVRPERGTASTARALAVLHARARGGDFDGPVLAASGPPGTELLLPRLIAAPDGALSLWFVSGEPGTAGQVERARSSDGGASWQRAPVAPVGRFPFRRDPMLWLGDSLGVATDAAGGWLAHGDNTSGRSRILLRRIAP